MAVELPESSADKDTSQSHGERNKSNEPTRAERHSV